MCVGPFSPPAPPPPPPLPVYDDAEQQRIEAEERRRLRNARGRDATILTLNAAPEEDDGRPVREKNLLGE
jgi:hypothetical protein